VGRHVECVNAEQQRFHAPRQERRSGETQSHTNGYDQPYLSQQHTLQHGVPRTKHDNGDATRSAFRCAMLSERLKWSVCSWVFGTISATGCSWA
jgi:hypothetical protein